jgi:hypothetical protein
MADAADPTSALDELLLDVAGAVHDPVIAEQIAGRLRREHAQPPCQQLEFVLRRAVPPQVARQLLFAPSADGESIGQYPRLIGSPMPGSPEDHPQRRVQITALAMLYLRHARHWPLMRIFVRHGGLSALAALFQDANLHLRSQALDTFTQITATPAYDWFAPPTVAADDTALHAAMLAVGAAPASEFLPALLANRSASFPGGAEVALQLLAFWLSWARKLHTGEQPLRVSRTILEVLQGWTAGRPSAATAIDAGDERGAAAAYTQAEADLAARLYADFSRFGAAGEGEADGTRLANEAAGASAPAADPCVVTGIVQPCLPADGGLALAPLARAPTSDNTAPSVCTHSETSAGADSVHVTVVQPNSRVGGNGIAAAAHKAAGNTHYGAERWDAAIAEYGSGVGALMAEASAGAANDSASARGTGGDASLSVANRELLATLLANRAAAHLRRAGYGADVAPPPALLKATAAAVGEGVVALRDTSDHLLACLADCERALRIDASLIKCMFRQAQALTALHVYGDALAVARGCMTMCTGMSKKLNAAQASDMHLQVTRLATHIMALQQLAAANDGLGGCIPATSAGWAGAGTPPAVTSSSTDTGTPTDVEVLIAASLLERHEFGGAGVQVGDTRIPEPEAVTESPAAALSAANAQAASTFAALLDESPRRDAGAAELHSRSVASAPMQASGAAPAGVALQRVAGVSVDDILSGRVRQSKAPGAGAGGGTGQQQKVLPSYLRNLVGQ